MGPPEKISDSKIPHTNTFFRKEFPTNFVVTVKGPNAEIGILYRLRIFQVGPKTSSGILHCLCTHLSAFGGDFLVAPNPIDFEKVWEQFGLLGETDNFLVLATVCIAYGAYLLGLVWARRADKRDEKKVNNLVVVVVTNAFIKVITNR